MSEKTQTIAMSGASGFVGSSLARRFAAKGWTTIPLGRREFSLPAEELAQHLQGVDCIVNLAGAPVISRWTKEYKKIMYQSRVDLTAKLVKACTLLERKPRVFLSASAIGCYASTGTHTEKDHVLADDFLANLTRDWEREAFRAKDLAIRTAIFRFGVILARDGGAMAKMLPPFRLGLGGTIGNGRQPFSWIHLTDLLRVFEQAINNAGYEGIYNLTAPHPTTNAGLTKALGKGLARPTIFHVPKFVLRLQFGDGAQILTSGQTVIPERLLASGFQFEFADIAEAVADCLRA
ncbi:MAG: TIGR01777 family oxidoreductase [Desulfobulbales bacterium]|nr:TIGR01777 family oxidoreductase [Desulfobulbales bacterium]